MARDKPSGGKRGRKAKPPGVKRAAGNPGKRPLPPIAKADARADRAIDAGNDFDDELQADLGAGESAGCEMDIYPPAGSTATANVQTPAWLPVEACNIWQALAPELERLHILQNIDAWTFARYCRNFARWLKLQDQLDREGETYEAQTKHGEFIKAHPAYMIADRLDRLLRDHEQEFCLNPGDRQRFAMARSNLGAGGSLFDPPKGGGERPPAKQPASAVGWLRRQQTVN